MGAPTRLFRERPGQVMGFRGDVRRSTAGAPVLPTTGLECLLGCNRPSEKSCHAVFRLNDFTRPLTYDCLEIFDLDGHIFISLQIHCLH
jgi:hypothetical protein